MKWYMITVISGKEDKVIEALKNRIIAEDLHDYFEDFLIMEIPYLSPRELKKKNAGLVYKNKVKNLFPGYLFVKMNMTNEAWFMVRNTQYVTGLVGSSGQRKKPIPVSNLEVNKMLKQVAKIKSDFDSGKVITPFKAGVVVEIIDGPAKGQIGVVLENSDERGIASIEVVLFERKTPVEIPHKFLQLKH